jgi:type I restriction enzyme S subunit
MDIETLAARYSGIPSHWKLSTLGESLTAIIGGGTPSRDNPSFWGGSIPWLTVKDMRGRRPSEAQEYITEKAVKESATNIIPPDTVITATRVGLGKVVRVPFAAAINQDLKALVVGPDLDKSYLEYWLVSIASFLEAIGSGTTVKGIRLETLRQLPIPLAPLDEQREIVAEIEKQFSRLDEAVANLQRVKANLKRYKASVLKAAVEGRLVETEASIAQREGRSYESAQELIEKTQSPPRPNRFNSRTGDVILGHGALAVGIPPTSVPEGWQWVNLVEIAKMETGHTPSRGHPEWWGGDVPWIGIADARDHHERSILKTIQYTNSDGLANSAARLLPAGTVCVSRTASVGYVVVMGKPMATSQDFVNWIPTSAVISDWLRVIFTADRDALIRFGKGTVHKTIYFPEWLSASIALPPLTEQARIVAEVDRHLSIISEVESEVDANLRRTQALRQATLSNKFSGS